MICPGQFMRDFSQGWTMADWVWWGVGAEVRRTISKPEAFLCLFRRISAPDRLWIAGDRRPDIQFRNHPDPHHYFSLSRLDLTLPTPRLALYPDHAFVGVKICMAHEHKREEILGPREQHFSLPRAWSEAFYTRISTYEGSQRVPNSFCSQT